MNVSSQGELLECLSGKRSTAIIAAHPDDETVGLGARLPIFRDASYVIVSDGSPENPADALAAGFTNRADYAAARRGELQRVLSMCGVASRQIQNLNLVDQRVSFAMDQLARELFSLLWRVRPEVVITHPYEGGHPDHDATALAVHAACRMLGHSQPPSPRIIEMTSYHRNTGKMEVESFLPEPNCDTVEFPLSENERCWKRRLLNCYATQRKTLSIFPVERELFRSAPSYDFTRPPHRGPLLYDDFNWGMTSAHWQELARAALANLDRPWD